MSEIQTKKKIDGKFDYYAFISYKREDEEWAKWLQHKLEHYKLPSNLNGRIALPKEIRPIFKDTSELSPGNLPQQIHDALEHSKYLIVICSPRSAKSEWVNREAEVFITSGRTEDIIPFIIEGTAYAKNLEDECFPLALRQLPEEKEILGANINEVGRDAAAVKVVARMFDIKFDTLWQRYERDKRKKRNILFVSLLVFMAFILGIAGYIWSLNGTISQQLKQAELSNATESAQYAIELMKNGNMARAEQIISSCYHETKQEKEIDGIVDMEKALRYWYSLKYGTAIYGDVRIDVSMPLSLWFSKDGTWLYVNEANAFLHKYNAENGNLMETISLPNNMMSLLDFDGECELEYLAEESVMHKFDICTLRDSVVMKQNEKAAAASSEAGKEAHRSKDGGAYFGVPIIGTGSNEGLEIRLSSDKTLLGTVKMTWSSRSWFDITPNERYLLYSDVGRLRYLDLTSETVDDQSAVDTKINDAYYGIRFSSDGSKIGINAMNSVYVWRQPSSLESIQDSVSFGKHMWDIEKSKDGHTEIRMYVGDVVSKTFKTKVKWEWDEGYASLCSTRGAETMAVSNGEDLCVYDTNTGDLIWADTLNEHVSDICMSNDEKFLCAACWDGLVWIYDIATGQIVKRLTGAEERLSYCKVSNDDKYVIAEDFTGKVCLWLLSTGQQVGTLVCRDNEVPTIPTIQFIKKQLLHSVENRNK